MKEREQNNEKNYLSHSKLMSGLGRCFVESFIGGLGGLAIGAAIGALLRGKRGISEGGMIGETVGATIGLAHGGIEGYKNAETVEENTKMLRSKLKHAHNTIEAQNKFIDLIGHPNKLNDIRNCKDNDSVKMFR